jgi:hypothetical protein
MSDGASARAFVRRDWGALTAAKDRSWLEERERTGVAGAFQTLSALIEHARSVRQDWPSEEEREADLDMHLRLLGVMRRTRCRAR